MEVQTILAPITSFSILHIPARFGMPMGAVCPFAKFVSQIFIASFWIMIKITVISEFTCTPESVVVTMGTNVTPRTGLMITNANL